MASHPTKNVEFHYFLQSKAAEEGREPRKETKIVAIRSFYPGNLKKIEGQHCIAFALDPTQFNELILPFVKPDDRLRLAIGRVVPINIRYFDEDISDEVLIKINENGEYCLMGKWISFFIEKMTSMNMLQEGVVFGLALGENKSLNFTVQCN